MAAPEPNATVAQKMEVAPGLMIMRVVPKNWELSAFKPGQFVVIGLPGSAERYFYSEAEVEPPAPEKLIKRAYSIASSSKENQYVEFYISLVRSGALTPRLFNLNIGDELWMAPKITGMFTMDQIDEDKNIILFATGTGVAPYMSMLRTNSLNHEKRNYAVVQGAYTSKDLGYRSELETIERFCPNFTYIPTISHPENEPLAWNGQTGFVQKVWEDRLLHEKWNTELTPDNTRIFLCGHPLMIDDMIELLGKKGFTEHTRKNPGSIHLERF